MRDAFFALADALAAEAHGPENVLLDLRGEQTDFVRFNVAKVRQAGHVDRHAVKIRLIHDGRHATESFEITGDPDRDLARGRGALARLRGDLPSLPPDPHLLIPTVDGSSTVDAPGDLPPGEEMVDAMLAAGAGLDVVGLLATGTVSAGFASSTGQRNWFRRGSHHFDWSVYAQRDKAVKFSRAGFTWDPEAIGRCMASARDELALLRRSPRTLAPGHYRVAFRPAAVGAMLKIVGRDGFGLGAQRRGSSALKRTAEGEVLSDRVTLRECPAAGAGPTFDDWGFVKPDEIVLFEAGVPKDVLVSARSAREYDVPCTGAGPWEQPETLQMDAGDIAEDAVLQTLDTGILVSNVHYLNYSDHGAGRFTGMTRFASYWVEGGEIVAPVDVMRFDDDVFRLFGTHLVGLTETCQLLLDPQAIRGRSTASLKVPGAIVDDVRFTL